MSGMRQDFMNRSPDRRVKAPTQKRLDSQPLNPQSSEFSTPRQIPVFNSHSKPKTIEGAAATSLRSSPASCHPSGRRHLAGEVFLLVFRVFLCQCCHSCCHRLLSLNSDVIFAIVLLLLLPYRTVVFVGKARCNRKTHAQEMCETVRNLHREWHLVQVLLPTMNNC